MTDQDTEKLYDELKEIVHPVEHNDVIQHNRYEDVKFVQPKKQNPATLYRCPECYMTTDKNSIALDGRHTRHTKKCSRYVEPLPVEETCCVMAGKDGIHNTHCEHFKVLVTE